MPRISSIGAMTAVMIHEAEWFPRLEWNEDGPFRR